MTFFWIDCFNINIFSYNKTSSLSVFLPHHSQGPCRSLCGARGPHMEPLRTGWAAGWFWWSSVALYHSLQSTDSTGTSWTTHSPLREKKNINTIRSELVSHSFSCSSRAAYRKYLSSEHYTSARPYKLQLQILWSHRFLLKPFVNDNIY